jgi:hypothetical protein
MDDGQKVSRGGVTLCTDSYSHNKINILREALKSNFNLVTTIHKKKGKDESVYERIYIKKDEFDEIKPSIASPPHMHESMLYKINEDITIKQDTYDIESNSGDIVNIYDTGEF